MGSGLQIAGTILGGLQVGKVIGQAQESSAQQTAIREQMVQQRLQLAQRATARTDNIRKTIGSQIAAEASRGIAIESPTFQALTQKSFKAFEQDDKADALNASFKESFLEQKLRQEKMNEFGEFSGDIESGAETFFGGGSGGGSLFG